MYYLTLQFQLYADCGFRYGRKNVLVRHISTKHCDFECFVNVYVLILHSWDVELPTYAQIIFVLHLAIFHDVIDEKNINF